ncbi:MAG: alpha/beta hydrolase [Flavobacteriaceae bacterium]|nr:alpha/beta hydrolase [Flavobacteriaceae bacterium]
MKKNFKIILGFFGILILVFFSGPKVVEPNLNQEVPSVPEKLSELNDWITARELKIEGIKDGNASRIEFYDSIPKKTKYSVLYMHGFSASSEEGAPFHQKISKHFKANLYLPRLFGHGIDNESPLEEFNGDQYIASALEALEVAKTLGDQVILLGTSNGGTLSLLLGNDPKVEIIGLYSPNIRIKNPLTGIGTLPWGLEIITFALGTNYHLMQDVVSPKEQFWTTRYHIQAITHVQKLIEIAMTPETFEKIKKPVFMGYYYKDEVNQDNVVSVEAMLSMFEQLGTMASQKEKMAFPKSGNHVMTSHITSKDVEGVTKESIRFFETHLTAQ